MKEAGWLENPRRARRRRRRARARRAAPRRRRNPIPMYAANPRRRRRRVSRRRSYGRRRARRNPPAFMGRRGLAVDLAYAGVGFMGSKLAGNFVTPMLGDMGAGQPLVRMAIKGATAYGVAWAWEVMMRDRAAFTPMFLGGAMSVVEDLVQTYIAPFFPTLLADYSGMGVYPGSDLGVYPQLGYQQYPYTPETTSYGMGAVDTGGYQSIV